ncbi:MAG TPA: hypothetical protein VM553_17365 [Dongiaceae bacterium]|nr:hypothetical protein [Dongiaceae bacterium]
MHYDAQIQMIVSTLKLAQTLAIDTDTGKAGMTWNAKLEGGCKSSHLAEKQAVVQIRESSRLPGLHIGQVRQRDGTLQISLVAPREYFSGLVELFPHCIPEQGGYLSFNFLLGSEVEMSPQGPVMKVLSMEYKMVKELSSNPDLISRG